MRHQACEIMSVPQKCLSILLCVSIIVPYPEKAEHTGTIALSRHTAVSPFFKKQTYAYMKYFLTPHCNNLSQIYPLSNTMKTMYSKHFVWKLQFYSHLKELLFDP